MFESCRLMTAKCCFCERSGFVKLRDSVSCIDCGLFLRRDRPVAVRRNYLKCLDSGKTASGTLAEMSPFCTCCPC